jgi:pimeloyl-ACP methyl ester carboxylesterase
VLSRTAPSLASRVAVNLFMTPRRHRRPDRERELLAHASPFDVFLGGATTIRAWRWDTQRNASAGTVLLVHGWEGRGSQLASFVRPLTAAGFSVVAFDAPAHGESSGTRSSLPHFAWSVRAVSDAIGSTHAIIAHSLGCAAATLALRDGLRTGRLVFLSPPLDPSDYVDRFGSVLGLEETVRRRMKVRIEERFARKWSDFSLERSAPAMTAPLLVIHDRDDDETLWSEGAALSAAWPGARLISTSGLGHRRILRDPGVIDDVTAFVTASN